MLFEFGLNGIKIINNKKHNGGGIRKYLLTFATCFRGFIDFFFTCLVVIWFQAFKDKDKHTSV